MSTLSSTERTRIQQQITLKESQLAAANTSYLSALQNAEAQSYKFDSGEGQQSVTRRRPSDIAHEINRLESEISRLYRRLDGTGLCNMNLRRRGMR